MSIKAKAKESAKLNCKKQVVNKMQKKVLSETSDSITIGESKMKNMEYIVIYHNYPKKDDGECHLHGCPIDDYVDIRGTFTNRRAAERCVEKTAREAVDTWGGEEEWKEGDISHLIKYHYTIEPSNSELSFVKQKPKQQE